MKFISPIPFSQIENPRHEQFLWNHWGGGDRLTRVVSESHFLAKHWNSCSLQEDRACCTCDGRPLGALYSHMKEEKLVAAVETDPGAAPPLSHGGPSHPLPSLSLCKLTFFPPFFFSVPFCNLWLLSNQTEKLSSEGELCSPCWVCVCVFLCVFCQKRGLGTLFSSAGDFLLRIGRLLLSSLDAFPLVSSGYNLRIL